MFIVYGGLGLQGKAILRFLLDQTSEKIVIFDMPEHPDDGFLQKGRMEYICAKTEGFDRFVNLKLFVSKQENEKIVLISCLPSGLNLELTKVCIAYRVNMVDLGGDTSVVLNQNGLNDDAVNSEVTIVPDCGIAPGLVSAYAGHYSQKEDVVEFHAYCGGIPKYPTNLPLGYSRVFGVQGVIKEYSGLALEIRDGMVTQIPTLSEMELVHIPGFGVLEANITSGGTSITPYALEGKLERFSYKTLRYAGHWDYIKSNIMSQADPEKVLDGMIEDAGDHAPDIIILSMKIVYKEDYELVDMYWEHEPGLSAMAKATGFPVAAVACMILESNGGTIRSGVVGMHELDVMEIEDRSTSIHCAEANFADLPNS